MLGMDSQYPTRLKISCHVCHGEALIDRVAYERAQLFCSLDGVPLTVKTVISGVPSNTERPTGKPLLITEVPKGTVYQFPTAVRHELAVV